jgi:hypothetical protein
MVTRKQKAEMAFNELVQDGQDTPESYVLKVMRGKVKLTRNSRDRYAAALALLPYRLPRLNSIDAQTRNVGMTHEQWIKSIEDEDGHEDPGGDD